MTESKSKGVVVITGASAGVGRACVRKFADEGYDVALLARGIDGLNGAKREVEEKGRKAGTYQVDIAKGADVEKVAEQIEQEMGPITIWINNAMNSVFSPIKKMDPLEFQRVTEVTYLGQVYGTLAALKYMLPRNHGSIVFVGSALAYRGIPLQAAYCGAKHAVQGFFDSLRSELLHDGSKVKVTMVQLPALNTTQFGFVKSRLPKKPRPMGTIYQPEVAAEGIFFAARHDRRELMVGWSTIYSIIGNKLAPWYGDRVLSRSGIKGQQTEEPEEPDRPHNLWHPLPGDHGAHGPFGEKAKSKSISFVLVKNKKSILMALLVLLIVCIMALILF